MTPGGITEIIWHFAGYLHLASEYAKESPLYEEGPAKRSVEDYTTARPDDADTADLDPFSTLRSNLPDAVPLADFVAKHLPYLKGLQVRLPPPPEFDSPDSSLAKLTPPQFSSGGGASGGSDFKITVAYGGDAGQTQIEIGQLNRLIDDDRLLVGDELGVTALQPTDINATLEAMASQAMHHVPDEFNFPQGTTEIAEFLSDYDQNVAANDGQQNSHSIEPGRYVNGNPDQGDVLPLPGEEPVAPDHGTAPGQWATLGANVEVNAALIVDLGESARSMIVMGDYFATNVFVQTNSYSDNDDIAASGSYPLANIPDGSNTADNIAEFTQYAGPYADLPATFAGPAWHVDVVNGNFYDIHLAVQQNYLSDNDIVFQQSHGAHYELVAGTNEQINLAEIFSGEFKYDLIIIAGSYHGVNVIFQHNILLDNDVLKVASTDGDDSPQSLNAGGNALLNNAQIAVYGGDNFLPWDGKLGELVNAIAAGQGELDPSFGRLLAGNGGTFNVLYVTGDYYDINAIWQVNVTADVDVALQLMHAPLDYPVYGDESGVAGQSLSSGENRLTNDAAIIDVQSTDAFVNGEVYGDTILIQANLVEEDDDHIAFGDTETLVTELIAFTDPSDEDSDAQLPVFIGIPHDDPMANVLN